MYSNVVVNNRKLIIVMNVLLPRVLFGGQSEFICC